MSIYFWVPTRIRENIISIWQSRKRVWFCEERNKERGRERDGERVRRDGRVARLARNASKPTTTTTTTTKSTSMTTTTTQGRRVSSSSCARIAKMKKTREVAGFGGGGGGGSSGTVTGESFLDQYADYRLAAVRSIRANITELVDATSLSGAHRQATLIVENSSKVEGGTGRKVEQSMRNQASSNWIFMSFESRESPTLEWASAPRPNYVHSRALLRFALLKFFFYF